MTHLCSAEVTQSRNKTLSDNRSICYGQGHQKYHPALEVRLGFCFPVSSHAEGVVAGCALYVVSGRAQPLEFLSRVLVVLTRNLPDAATMTLGSIRCGSVSGGARWKNVRATDMIPRQPRRRGWRVSVVCGLGLEKMRTAPIYEAVTGTSRYPLASARACSVARLRALRFCSNLAAPWSTQACPLVIRRYTSTPR